MDPKLKQLQTQWYKKLKDKGFKDIERADGKLREYDSLRWHKSSLSNAFATQRYYELARQLLWTFPFPSLREKAIWRHHSEGASVAEIVKMLGLGKREIENSINRIKKHITNE